MQDHLSDIKYLLSPVVMAWEESTQPWLCPESQGFLTRLTLKINWGGFGVMDLQNQVKETVGTWWSSVWAPMRTKNMGPLTGGRQGEQKHQNGSKSGESLCQSQLLSFLNVRSTLQVQALGGCCLHQHAMKVVLCFSCSFRKSFSYNFPCSFQKEIQKSSFHHCIWMMALEGSPGWRLMLALAHCRQGLILHLSKRQNSVFSALPTEVPGSTSWVLLWAWCKPAPGMSNEPGLLSALGQSQGVLWGFLGGFSIFGSLLAKTCAWPLSSFTLNAL